MSSSISLGTFDDLETLASKSLPETENNISFLNFKSKDVNKSNKRSYKDYNIYYLKSSPPTQSAIYPSNSGPKRNQSHEDSITITSHNFDVNVEEDFYEEVDERMSRNSFEYPQQQAKYVGKWLNDMELLSKSRSINGDDSSHNWGNIIGIRGFQTNEAGEKESEEHLRGWYNKMKIDFSKLQSEHDNQRALLDENERKLRKTSKNKDYDIHRLRASINAKRGANRPDFEYNRPQEGDCMCKKQQIVSDNDKTKHPCDEHKLELERLRYELNQMELKLDYADKEFNETLMTLKGENERLKNQAGWTKDELEKNLDTMRNEVRVLSLEPNNRMVMALRNENCRLKETAEQNVNEFQVLKESYTQLESQLRSMIEERKYLDDEKNEEISRMMVELCRLQVYQPKLEMILETEREIKLEFQGKVKSLQDEINDLRDQLKDKTHELNNERLRSKNNKALEMDELEGEVVRWREKCYRLKKDKSDVEDLLRSFKSRLTQLDARYQSDVELVKETSRCELDKMNGNVFRLEKDRNKLCLDLEELKKKSNQSDLEKQKLTRDLIELNGKLEISLANKETNEMTLKRLKAIEDREVALTSQLKASEMKNSQLMEERETFKMQYERFKQQVDQFQQRFQHQQRAFDELKEKKDKELDKLRVNLNFEQYNRQVALKGIEKELRVSLKDLEAMKYRFSRRLAQSDSIGEKSRVYRINGDLSTTKPKDSDIAPLAHPSQPQPLN